MTYNRSSRVAHLDWGRHPTLQCLVPISAFSSPHHHIRLYSTSQKSENAKSRVMFCTSLQLNEPNTRSSRRSIPLLSGIFFFCLSLFFFFFPGQRTLKSAHVSISRSSAQLNSIQLSWAEPDYRRLSKLLTWGNPGLTMHWKLHPTLQFQDPILLTSPFPVTAENPSRHTHAPRCSLRFRNAPNNGVIQYIPWPWPSMA